VGGCTLYPGFHPGLVCCAPLGLDAMLLKETTFCGFGHLGGSIMEVFCLARRFFVISFIDIFAVHSNKTRGSPNIGGVLPTSEGVFNAKQAILREFKTIFCAYAHAAT
jgi:hypothetical protein